MAEYKVTDTELTDIADAIRTKGGTSAQLSFPTGFVNAIGNISGGAAFLTIQSGGDQETSEQYLTNAAFANYDNIVGISTALGDAALADLGALGVITIAFAYTTDVKKHFKLKNGYTDHFTANPILKSGNRIGVADADFIGDYYVWMW